MEWNKGYSTSYYATKVDPKTWLDTERIEITGGSVKREPSGLRESADIACRYDVDIEQWIRVYMDTSQGGANAHTALFTGLASAPKNSINGVIIDKSLECYSVLKPCDDVLLPRGWYAAAGRKGGDIIRDLLAPTPAPVEIAEDSPALDSSIIAEDGETNLTMIDLILSAINWRIRIDGDGTVNIVPKAAEASARLDPISNDVIEPKVSVTADWYSCPNVFRAISDGLTAVAYDDDEDSKLSTEARGREIWSQETSVDLADNESITEYAARRLKELQTVAQTVSYDRRYIPDILPGDLILLAYPAQGLDGLYKVESQSITLGYNAKTSEALTEVID